MSNNKGLGKGLGALISMFDEDMEELTNAEKKATPAEKETRDKAIDFFQNELTASIERQQKSGTQNVPSSEQIVPRGTISADSNSALSVQEIAVDLIDRNISQPRKHFDYEAMNELKQSIVANGVLQPILVNRVGSRYMIVAGERRWRATKEVGLKTIPALVRNYSPRQIAEIALVENLMRSDLNEIEIASGIKTLMQTHNMTQEQVSKVLGKSRSSIANSLRYLNLPLAVQHFLQEKQISAGHATCLVAVADPVQCVNLANKCVNGMSVHELESITGTAAKDTLPRLQNVPRGTFSSGNSNPIKKQSIELKQFQLTLTHLLATRVDILGDDNFGKIEIKYDSRKDLERIMALLGKIK